MLIVFGGSSFLFPAFFGAMAAIRERGIRSSAFAGTSGGSIAAALFASGMGPAKALELTIDHPPADFCTPNRRFWQPARSMGLFTLRTFETFLSDYVPETFATSPWPLTVVTTDLDKREAFYFSSGLTPNASVAKAICASCSVPFLFAPVVYEGRLLADGGIVNTFAVDLRGGGEGVLGVRLLSSESKARKITKRLDLVTSVVGAMMDESLRKHIAAAPFARVVTITLPYSQLDMDMGSKEVEDLYERGWKQTYEALRVLS